jgi:hypothetical protein
MPKSSIASSIKRCLGTQSSNVKRSILAGSPMTSTFEASFPASTCSSVTQVLQGGLYLHLNIITKIQLTPHNSLVKCTLESGGGQCRYVKISLHIVYYLHSPQQSLESHRPGTTVIPIILSSDKTQLTHFRSKSTYPIYMSIGNIPKDICSKPTQQAQMLLGYIPMTQLEHIKNKAGQCCALANLFHACMHKILSGIEHYGETGIAMATGDGVWYCCHPILVTFVSNYPEQSLVACTPYGRCPKCSVP